MNLLVLPGDDIGPEITAAALKVLDRANAVFLLGLCGTTEYPPRQEAGINVPGTIRKRLDLHANIRPARSRPGPHKALTPQLEKHAERLAQTA